MISPSLHNGQVHPIAAIYIRTSSEHQAEKASPEEQESDCRKLAEQYGLTVVAVYRDIERYRVGRRMVDPSGTRSDRPGLQAMLADAAAGKFGTILAWREDRLYRAMRVMLLVLETIQEHKVTILLARETFDQKMAPLKAWLAQMELEGMRERLTMGVKARLRAGKANTGQDKYGYRRVGEVIVIDEEEASWVRQILEWYVQGETIMEIRRRLIAANAPQKGSSRPRKVQWHTSSINAILGTVEAYASGIKIQRRDGEAFEIPAPPIIDMATCRRVQEVREAKKKHPAQHQKRDYLIAGLLYCACEMKWGSRANPPRTSRLDRKGNLRPWADTAVRAVYFCGQRHRELVSPECPRTIGSDKADNLVWEKVRSVIEDPDLLIIEARRYLDELKQGQDGHAEDRERIEKELEVLARERRWVITQARRGAISEADMDYQLSELTVQELTLRHDLAETRDVLSLAALEDWESQARQYISDLRASLEWLDAIPQNDEERRQQFEMKRQIVKSLVEKIVIEKDRNLRVVFHLDVVTLLERAGMTAEIDSVGIYTRTR